jgi:small conductance mechanosensitive channel
MTPELIEACGEKPGVVCESVFGWTSNRRLAEAAEWLVGTPLRILLVCVIALLLNRLVRGIITRAVARFLDEHREPRRFELRLADKQMALLVERAERARQRALTMSAVLCNLATVAIFSVATLMVLSELGVNLAPLIAGAGIIGIAVGFGSQALVRDFISGMFLVIEDQFGVGDTVDLGEAKGVVERVTLRTTSLRDVEGNLWVVPNGEIRRVANKSQLWARAVLDVRVDYDADLDRAIVVLQEVASDLWQSSAPTAGIIEEPQVLGIESFGDGVTVVRLSAKTAPGAQFEVARMLRARIKAAFDREGIAGLASGAELSVAPPPPKRPARPSSSPTSSH